MECPKIGLVGIGGFGRVLLKYIGKLQSEGQLLLEAVCDIQIERHFDAINEAPFATVKTYKEYETFLGSERQLDAIIIATPIPLHVEMGIQAMEAGFNVMLEKPPAITIQDIDQMIDVHFRTGKTFAVGFQHTSETSFKRFCRDIQMGRIGSVTEISAAGLWKRTRGYFTRSPWVGKLFVDGQYVLDGTLNNPFSHLLMNCLVVAGLQSVAEVSPESVQAELYSANNIESEDTSCVRALMNNGVEIFFCTSICANEPVTPFIKVMGNEGWAYWDYDGWVRYEDLVGGGREEIIVECDRRYDHLLNFVDYLRGRTSKLSCSIEDTRKFVLTSNLAFESARSIRKVGSEFIRQRDGLGQIVSSLKNPEDYLFVQDIDLILQQAVAERKLFSELGIDWAVRSEPAFASGYDKFDLFKSDMRSPK